MTRLCRPAVPAAQEIKSLRTKQGNPYIIVTIDGNNYAIWSNQILVSFGARGLLQYIEELRETIEKYEPRDEPEALISLLETLLLNIQYAFAEAVETKAV